MVASRNPARAAAYAAEWRIPQVHTYDGLLADPDIDVVYVPLPNSLHAAWTIRACEAGKHVLCEKPLATSAADVDAIAAAAERHRRIVAEGFMYRHHAQTARILDIVGNGTIGALRTLATAFTFTLTREADVRLHPALGGGSLWDVGCYPVSLAQVIMGREPNQIAAAQQVGAAGVDESFSAIMRYEGDVTVQFHCGFHAAYQSFARFIGTEGVLHVERPFRPEGQPMLLSRGGTTEEISVPGAAIFEDEIADMEDSVLGVKPPRISLAESRMHVATLERLYRAARNGPPASTPAS